MSLDRDAVLSSLTESGVQAVYRSIGVESFQTNGPEHWITRSSLRKDAKPSFSIRRDNGVWNDRSTGEGGSIFNAVMLTQGYDFPAAIEYVANLAGMSRAVGRSVGCISGRGAQPCAQLGTGGVMTGRTAVRPYRRSMVVPIAVVGRPRLRYHLFSGASSRRTSIETSRGSFNARLSVKSRRAFFSAD